MKLLSMGCLSSRSTIAPSDSVDGVETGQKSKISKSVRPQRGGPAANNHLPKANGANRAERIRDNTNALQKDAIKKGGLGGGGGGDRQAGRRRINKGDSVDNSSLEPLEDDVMSILMNDREESTPDKVGPGGDGAHRRRGEAPGGADQTTGMILGGRAHDGDDLKARGGTSSSDRMELMEDSKISSLGGSIDVKEEEDQSIGSGKKSPAEGSFDEEPDIDLLRQYVAVDYEITLLEDKDALRVYHEKIEQLEQLERELDMISAEAEEVAGRSDSSTAGGQLDLGQAGAGANNNGLGHQQGGDPRGLDGDSMASGATGSINLSHKSWTESRAAPSHHRRQTPVSNTTTNKGGSSVTPGPRSTNARKGGGISDGAGQIMTATGTAATGTASTRMFQSNNSSYSTVEGVFNRKIILEKERDKLKKEVEMVIVECDKLQQKYKKRDDILDKLFDGKTGNGLENHLEQQLNWLMEQKHYVDQVFYAWKRAETLTSQTCEQFASALELLKRYPKVQDEEQKSELAKNIGSLLVKSRQDMEQAQKYNPNVDAPFFTDNETERFDKIIAIISSESINQSDHSQIMTVIQFAYKRAVSIRLWLEQILQTTIARDSFELAEEYKWIAIQLRKERINLIKSKLQSSPYHSMAQSIRQQMARQHSLTERRQHEINRDSGVESETNDIDIEEEIYRLLELNKSRLEGGSGGGGNANAAAAAREPRQQKSGAATTSTTATQGAKSDAGGQQQLRVAQPPGASSSSSSDSHRDQLMRDRIQKRVKGDKPLHMNQVPAAPQPPRSMTSAPASDISITSLGSSTISRLRVELDEATKQSLLKQVDEVHLKHKSRMERLRGNNKAIAASTIMDRMQQIRSSSQTRESVTQRPREPANQTGNEDVAELAN